MLQEILPLNVFSSKKTLLKEINIYFPWPMRKENNLTGNTFGPKMEEFFSDKAMTAESLQMTAESEKRGWCCTPCVATPF